MMPAAFSSSKAQNDLLQWTVTKPRLHPVHFNPGHTNRLMKLRYLSTVEKKDSLRIQQDVELG